MQGLFQYLFHMIPAMSIAFLFVLFVFSPLKKMIKGI